MITDTILVVPYYNYGYKYTPKRNSNYLGSYIKPKLLFCFRLAGLPCRSQPQLCCITRVVVPRVPSCFLLVYLGYLLLALHRLHSNLQP